jgi:hypothetical protein
MALTAGCSVAPVDVAGVDLVGDIVEAVLESIPSGEIWAGSPARRVGVNPSRQNP